MLQKILQSYLPRIQANAYWIEKLWRKEQRASMRKSSSISWQTSVSGKSGDKRFDGRMIDKKQNTSKKVYLSSVTGRRS